MVVTANYFTLGVVILKSFHTDIETKHIVEISWVDRWQVYHRLQELDIPCDCESNQPLEVEISNPIAAIQLWSVIQQFTASRPHLIRNLENCWQSQYRQY